VGWRAEWALRLPFVLCGVAGVWAVFHLVRRLAGGRAAVFSGLILATSTQWALISRQAMTDMAFVAPMTVGLCFAALALLLPQEEVLAELPRRQVLLGGLRISWPHDRAFYVFLGLFLLCAVPQLLIYSVQLGPWHFVLGGHTYRTAGIVAVLPWIGLFLLTFAWVLHGRNRRSIYLWVTYLMGGLANLAKGPAGLAMPVLVVLLFVVVTLRFREFLGPRRQRPWAFGRLLPEALRPLAAYDGGLEILRGALIFLVVGAPWYVAMLARHGAPFWMELIGDNYIRRAQGRHGDRGTFEYYLRQLGAGLFPWSGVVATALVTAGRWLRQGSPQRQLAIFALTWFLADFMVVSLVNTKFHHYILPALPALAILGGLFISELIEGHPEDRGVLLTGLGLIGLPLAWLSGRDLANFPARIGWLFNYDYVNAPGTGRPWPLVSIYGQRYEYQASVMVFAVLGLLAAGLLLWAASRRQEEAAPAPEQTQGPRTFTFLGGWIGLLLCAGMLFGAIAAAPGPELVATWSSSKLPVDTVLPWRLRAGFLVPAAAAAVWLLLWLWPRGARAWAAAGMVVLGIGWNCWVLDRFLVDISPHWSQKHVFSAYYRLRKGPEEPVVAWYMYWRGENFYTRNQIYDHRLDPGEKTVFLGDHHAEKLQAYLNSHRGRRIFFLLERHRLELLRNLLPPESRPSLQVVDESNNKVYMAVAQL
jgi:4-amino-4-deoxy-L-arabinose transferase-like glycosyltransferase